MVYSRRLYKLFGKQYKKYLSHRATDDSAPLCNFSKNYTLVEVKNFPQKLYFASR